MNSKKLLSFMLAALMAAGALISCGSETETPADTANTAADSATESTAEPDLFAVLDFGGEKIRFYVNANDYYGSGSSNDLIKHDEETTGDIVKEAVYKRNTFVEELLNVEIVFEDCDYIWSEITEPLANTISAGDDAYDVVVHDLFPPAYNNYCNNFPMSETFVSPLGSHKSDFASSYDKGIKAAQAKLDSL